MANMWSICAKSGKKQQSFGFLAKFLFFQDLQTLVVTSARDGLGDRSFSTTYSKGYLGSDSRS